LWEKLVLSADYNRQGLGSNNIYTNRRSFNIEESLLQNDFQPVLDQLLNSRSESFAFGAELKLKNFFLRAGYRLDESAYQSEFKANTVADLETLSGGIAYQSGPWTFNITYLNSQQDYTQVGYRGFDENGDAFKVIDDISVSRVNQNVIIGVGYKF
jgi:hypothetical protein